MLRALVGSGGQAIDPSALLFSGAVRLLLATQLVRALRECCQAWAWLMPAEHSDSLPLFGPFSSELSGHTLGGVPCVHVWRQAVHPRNLILILVIVLVSGSISGIMTFTNEAPAGPTSIILLVLLIAAELATFGRALLAEWRAQMLETSQNIPELDPEVSKTASEECNVHEI